MEDDCIRVSSIRNATSRITEINRNHQKTKSTLQFIVVLQLIYEFVQTYA